MCDNDGELYNPTEEWTPEERKKSQVKQFADALVAQNIEHLNILCYRFFGNFYQFSYLCCQHYGQTMIPTAKVIEFYSNHINCDDYDPTSTKPGTGNDDRRSTAWRPTAPKNG